MAERIDFKKIDRDDPRFLEADPDNPNTNISASKYNPTDPTADVENPNSASAKYDVFLRTANIGDTFDFGDGTLNKFTGFNKMGTPMIQTIESDARQNWRNTMSGATTFAGAVDKLKAAGFNDQMAQFLVRQSGSEFQDQGNYSATTQNTSLVSNANSAVTAALQAQITALIEQGKLAEAKRLQDKASFDAEIKAQAAASKLAYDTAAQDKADAIKVERVSAFETLKVEFEKYGLGSLVEDVKALVLNGTPKSQALLKLRATPEYKLRFAGNTQRLAEGKNLYDESTYLALENDFRASFEAYGQKALLGKTRESAQAMFADYIGSDKSPTEIKDRIRLAVDEVSNRKDIRSEFQKFFPEITDSDLVSYFLKPKETLSALTAKVRVAQIGSAASAQGLNASLATATDLEQLGLTEQQAKTGYQRVATDLPTIEKLGDIDKTDISQTTAENAYLKGLASEQRKIDQAAQRERNRFAQSSGVNKISLTDAKAAGQY